MDCREAEEQIVPYLMGSLESRELEVLERHVEGCPTCSLRLQLDGEIVVDLAYAVPQQAAPPRVKERLLNRIAEDTQPAAAAPRRRWTDLLGDLSQWVLSHPSAVATSVLMLMVVSGGVWFNERLNHLAGEKDVIASKVESMAQEEAEMSEKVSSLVDLSYVAAAPDTSVNPMSPMQRTGQGRGMILVPRWGHWAFLAAYDLPELPPSKVYQVWVVKDNAMYDAGTITVDNSGYGGTRLSLAAPFYQIDTILITVESVGETQGPTGESVLTSDF